ncbi:GNAT family N-acetyltransferase [Pedobacter sp. KR3-3]|uniref:GNAT family N-acetyltransferase n=1 Tax=Pedobacter albus TaxID=3113905 RepID=A0ABU7I992_9SPHI|nr:GNAT family N-acetyltransferase [Pedobacter sp. KR3-3]MEE1945949.1 GNAT family N-acetyltransferase [Pedobacter sp. KR3-3]
MIFREATTTTTDIKPIQMVRNSVKENRLSDPSLVSDADCEEFINRKGKGWVCEINQQIVGFAIADLQAQNIWALFVHPQFENHGIGKQLHQLMLDWYFAQGPIHVWLSTAPGTRAETFYQKAGWKATGMQGKEIRFEMSLTDWKKRN